MASGSRERPPHRTISDTARWVAVCRAQESARPDAVFRDPLAARLAGVEGKAVAGSLPASRAASWPIVARTHVIDRMVAAQVARGTDVVINLLAGLDTRPYRLRLPASLKWVEVDLPDLLAYKVDRLMGERAACKVERIACDLSDRDSRRELLGKINLRGRHILAIGEGLPKVDSEASALAEDLHRARNVRHWIVEIVKPARFGRSEGAAQVERSGWKAIETDSMIETAAKLGRLPWYLKPFTLLADSWTPGRVPSSSVCLLERA